MKQEPREASTQSMLPDWGAFLIGLMLPLGRWI